MNRSGWMRALALVAVIGSAASLPSVGKATSGHMQARSTSSFSDGMFAVGRDIAPGIYHTTGGDGCYWARLRKLSTSSLSAIIANDNASGPITIQIKRTDVGFESENCGTWHLVRVPGHRSNLKTTFGDGTYGVGIDIRPGTYRTLGGDNCYWDRSRDLGGATSAIIANDNAAGPAIVSIAPTDAGFKTNACGIWRSIPAPHAGGSGGKASFGDGTWRVGIDVKPGTYHTDGGDGCYYEQLSGFSGGLNDIIANDNPSGPVTLTIESTQLGFKSKGCGTWRRLH